MRVLSIIDAPSDLGLRRTGVQGLPDALREAGLFNGLPHTIYGGRLPVPAFVPELQGSTGIANADAIASFSRRLADRVSSALDQGHFPLVLGGDCSILLGSVLALRRRGRYGLFFIDGHADFYSPETEVNSECASMDLALALGRGPDVLADIDRLRPLVRDTDTVVYGVRDQDLAAAEESPDVRESAAQVIDLAEVRRLGPTAAARRGLETLAATGVEGFWLHLDADVLNDVVMPAVDYRMPDGLWPEELTETLSILLSSPLIAGVEITIYNPTFDDEQRSAARTLVTAIRSASSWRD